jgi:hypothetical protein
MAERKPFLLLYGSQTGQAKAIAEVCTGSHSCCAPFGEPHSVWVAVTTRFWLFLFAPSKMNFGMRFFGFAGTGTTGH